MSSGISCQIADTIEFLSRKHLLRILSFILQEKKPLRFKDFTKELKINSKTLTDRLQDLERAGIIGRISFDQIPPRVEYSITQIGLDIEPILDELRKFELKHVVPTE